MKLRYSFLIIILLLATACKKFTDVGYPKTQQLSGQVFSDDASATAAMLNIYAQMALLNEPTPYQVSLYSSSYVDELTDYSGSNDLSDVYLNALNARQSLTNAVWTQAYNCIYQANAIYEGCSNSSRLNSAVKKQLMAEALFIRAYWHFYLVNFYDDVPLILTTDYKTNAVAGRTPAAEVYRQIAADLIAAEGNLNAVYTDGSNVISTERLRPNKYCAAALLARVYLYMGSNELAEKQATLILTDKATYDTVALSDVFLKDSREAIWQLAIPSPNFQDINTTEGANYILVGDPGTSGSGGTSTLSPQLLSAFEIGDNRRQEWVGVYQNGTNDYYYPNKYKIRTGSAISECSTVLRVAEQYLIRAEARARQNNLAGAISDLDVIRKRAGLPSITTTNPGIGQADLLKAILKERQVELFTEGAHRWLDLKRTGRLNEVMSIVSPIKGGSWSTNKQYWPLPLTEIQNDPNLVQNPGYN